VIATGRLPVNRRRSGARHGEAGASVLELTATAGLALALAALSVPALAGRRDALRAAGAARHLAVLVHATRTEALKRGVHVGLVFQPSGSDVRFAMFADGNDDGVRAADVASSTDRQVSPWVRIGDQFPGTAFGILPGVADPDSGASLSGNPLKLGGSSVLSFAPDGAATSGTVYLQGHAGQQYAVRLLGATGRSRLLRFDFRTRQWVAA